MIVYLAMAFNVISSFQETFDKTNQEEYTEGNWL